MSKTFIVLLVVIILVMGGYGVYYFTLLSQGSALNNQTQQGAWTDPLNATYIIEGKHVTLANGQAEEGTIPNQQETKVFGDPIKGDLNADGVEDDVLFLTQNGGGSGTFYYVAAALNINGQTIGTNAISLGDRVTVQDIRIENEVILVNYIDRHPWESFAEQPSVNKTKRLIVENETLKEKPQEVILSATTAESLALQKWGDCTKNDCSKFSAEAIDAKDGIWYVAATYDGLRDDSIKAETRYVMASYQDGSWSLGPELIKTYQCQPGRGHDTFSREPCL
ncbi:MAG: hypothetical protein PHN39_03145 [Candidatus Pacebacteria bacterium]|nr:hypothetical protein [Candidatus Paceibacterota bacterium]